MKTKDKIARELAVKIGGRYTQALMGQGKIQVGEVEEIISTALSDYVAGLEERVAELEEFRAYVAKETFDTTAIRKIKTMMYDMFWKAKKLTPEAKAALLEKRGGGEK